VREVEKNQIRGSFSVQGWLADDEKEDQRKKKRSWKYRD